MKDIVVIQTLQKRGVGLGDINEVLRYEAVERKPRILDKAPKRLNMTKASDIQSYGCCSEFVMCFNEVKTSSNLEQAVIDLRGVRRYCDVDVYYVLQALIKQGFCMSENRAAACFDVFKVIMTTPGETLTTARVYESIKNYKALNYYAEELIKGINIALYGEKAPVLYWVSLCEYAGFYSKALELGKEVIRKNCESEKEVERFLRPYYKAAKEDKEFMEGVFTQGANKWMVPMLYYLKDKHPEALEPNTSDEGFA